MSKEKQIGRQTSGLEKIPPFLTSPFWKESLFWWFVASVIFWGLVIWLIF